jgi:hypothetical protein
MLGSVGGSIADLVRGMWRSEQGNRWLLPLAVFLCLFGAVLILAMTVEALAPFIYAIFWVVDAIRSLLACPACGGTLERDWSCCGCGARCDVLDGIPVLRLATDERTDAVRRFYHRAPFPGYPPRDSLQALRARAERSPLPRLIKRCQAKA